jgi:hypothetical protein
LPNITRRQQQFEIWLRPVPPQNSLFALRAALYETEKLIRDGIPAAGFETTRIFLTNYSNLWAQDVSRRLGFAIDAVVTGKDVVKELQARLPKMKKADVDRAVRKHLGLNGLSIAIVAEKGQEIADKLAAASRRRSSTTPPARPPTSRPRTRSSSGFRCRSRRTRSGSSPSSRCSSVKSERGPRPAPAAPRPCRRTGSDPH